MSKRIGPELAPCTDIATTFGFKALELRHVKAHDYHSNFPTVCAAFSDLSEILNIPTKFIGLNRTVTLGIGPKARNTEGTFYSPKYRLINLSETAGQGSLAHEWFHSLDYCAGIGEPASCSGKFDALVNQIKALPLHQRSIEMDRDVGAFYFQKNVEMTARVFESFIERWLSDRGRLNEYLVSTEGQELVYPNDVELDLLTPFIINAVGASLDELRQPIAA